LRGIGMEQPCDIPRALRKTHLIRTKFKHERSTDPNE